MDRRQPIDRLHFDEKPAFDREIGSEPFRENQSVEFDRDGLLPLYGEPGTMQACRHDRFIDRFEESRPEVLVDPQPAIHRDPRKALPIPHLTAFRQSRSGCKKQIGGLHPCCERRSLDTDGCSFR
jgi:hypothetical protein